MSRYRRLYESARTSNKVEIYQNTRSENWTANDIDKLTIWTEFQAGRILNHRRTILQEAPVNRFPMSTSPPEAVSDEFEVQREFYGFMLTSLRRALRCGFSWLRQKQQLGGITPVLPGITKTKISNVSMASEEVSWMRLIKASMTSGRHA